MKTKSKAVSMKSQVVSKLEVMMSKGKLKEEDIKLFEDEELRALGPYLTERLNELKGEEFDNFFDKLEAIMPKSTKNQIWHNRHNQILSTISNLMREYGRMPSPYEISNNSGISAFMVGKHLKEYSKDSQHLNSLSRFQFMTSKVLAKVFKYAVNGDMRAAKLYFDVVGNLTGNPVSNTVVNTQNNYIQINQLKVTQEELKQLKPEQLQKVEDLLKEVVTN